MNRAEICQHVGRLITEDRNATHGDPHEQFDCAQELKTDLRLYERPHLLPQEIEALQMICTKLSRIVNGKSKCEHWEDVIGYAAIAAEAREDQDALESIVTGSGGSGGHLGG